MRYGSVCSGVEAATVAWKGLGFEPQWFSEIEKFPSAVLQHHYPNVPNYGDMTKFKEWPDDRSISLLVGGTPCQSFSVAGLRKGLADPRGNLMLTYLAIADRYRPRWLVWENVPGVLSSNRGRDFGTFLGALGKLRYGFAYRVLDAQYFRLAQRRKRVFVVAHLGDWRRAAAVLFERESLSGHPAPCRKKRQEAADTLTVGANQYSGFNGEPVVAGSLDTQCGGGKLTHQSANNGHLILERDTIGTLTARSLNALGARDVEEGVILPVGFDSYNQEVTGEISKTVAARSDQDPASCIAFGAQNSSAQGLSASEHITPTLDKSKTPAVAFAQNQSGEVRQGDVFNTINTNSNASGRNTPLLMQETQAVAWSIMPMNSGKDYKARPTDVAQPLMASGPVGGNQGGDFIQEMQVRRLTPTECERLQGFPDSYTQIPYRNKPAENCPDGPRYKAMGNSMAVPVMRWIGKRIKMVDEL